MHSPKPGTRDPDAVATTRHVLAALAVAIASAVLAATSGAQDAATPFDYRNQRFGFSLQVPPDTFVGGTPRNPDIGGLWVSRDGRARLIAVAARNETGETLEGYRRFVMQQTYGEAKFDYTPVRENWFVLSGRKDNQLFYERITFACGGRYIYGWQLMYPRDERRRYDRIVEAIHRSYRPGQGEDGNCG